MENKTLPYNSDAEKAVLCCLVSEENITITSGVKIKEQYFYFAQNRIIMQAISEMQTAAISIDLITLKNQLVKNGKLSAVGGLPYLTGLMNEVSTTANFKHYAEIIIEKYRLRKIILASTNAMEKSYANTASYDVIGALSSELLEQSESNSTVPETMLDYWSEYEKEQAEKNEAKNPGISTGFVSIDEAIGGMVKGTFCVIAARPGMGKSQLGLQFAANSSRVGIPAGLISLEMKKIELTNRTVSNITGIKYNKVRNPHLMDSEDRARFIHDTDKIKRIIKNLVFDYCPNLTASELIMKIRLIVHKYKVETIYIDYLGLLDFEIARGELKSDAIGRLTRALKVLAGELDITIAVLSQLNRDVEKRPDKRPMLSDLRDSGSIEQDADLIMFLYREHYYTHKEFNADGRYIENLAEVIIAKQRNGPTTIKELRFDGSRVTFSDDAEKKQEELF